MGDTLKFSIRESYRGEPTCLPPPWKVGLMVLGLSRLQIARLPVAFLAQLVGFQILARTEQPKLGEWLQESSICQGLQRGPELKLHMLECTNIQCMRDDLQ